MWVTRLAKFPFERAGLFIVGMVLLGFAVAKINSDNVLVATGSGALAALCLFFSNLTRFKKFKGLGVGADFLYPFSLSLAATLGA